MKFVLFCFIQLIICTYSLAASVEPNTTKSRDLKKLKLETPKVKTPPPAAGKSTPQFLERHSSRILNKSSIKQGSTDALFNQGWQDIEESRPKQAQEIFKELIMRSKSLDLEQKSDAYLGYGIATFHQKGCAAAKKPLTLATGFPKNKDDAYYYLALCDVENKTYHLAKKRFDILIGLQHPRYGETSKFYRAVIDEEELKYEEAKSAYQDLADFSSDKRLVEMAKIKIATIEYKMAKDRRVKKRVTAAASLGLGHDTNATQLPQGLDPATQAIDSESSFTTLGMLLLEYRLPYASTFDQVFTYNLLLLHYNSHKISLGSDVHSQDFSTKFNWDQNAFSTWSLGANFNYLFLGEIKKLNAYMATLGSELSWARVINNSNGVHSQFLSSLSVSRQESIKGFASSQDPEAMNYSLNIDWTYLRLKNQTLGPALTFEYHPAKGSENTYFRYALGANWDWTMIPSWGVRWGVGAEASNSRYMDSSTNRNDWLFSGNTSLAKTWGTRWDTRIQLTSMHNKSNVPLAYQYNKLQSMFVLTAIF